MKPITRFVLTVLFAGITNSNLAMSQDVDSGIQPLRQNGITYVTGGTGADQQQAMANIRAQYDFRATFAVKKTGEYLADVNLAIENSASGKVFDGSSLGPLFFAKLPPGKYKVTASSGGKTQVQSIILKKSGAKDIYFYWAGD